MLSVFRPGLSPKSLGGCVLDLHAKDLPPGALSLWPDIGGLANNFAAGAGEEPTAVASGGPNNRPYVNFPANKYLANALNAFGALSAADIYVVVRVAVAAGANGIWRFGPGVADWYEFGNGHVFLGAGSSARSDCGIPLQDITQWHLLRITSTGAEYTVSVGTQALFTTAVNVVSFPATCWLGTNDAAASWLVGDMARMTMFSRKLSAREDYAMKTEVLRSEYNSLPGF